MRSKSLKRAAAFATAFIMSLGTISVLPEESFPMFSFTAFAEGTVVESGQCGDKVFYELDSEGTLTISGTGDMWDYETWDYDFTNYSPFIERNDIINVIIKNGVTSVGDALFKSCTNIETVAIPDGVTKIGVSTFYKCSSLNNINIPNSVTSIGFWAFSYCSSLSSISVPSSITSIGNSVFSSCSGLTNIELPDTITSIGENAFWGCSNLSTMTIPYGVTTIESSTFYKCSSLTNITIPNSVTLIEYNAFYGCSNLTSVVIPNSVVEIGPSSFKNCTGLRQITAGDNVTSIGDDAFKSCEITDFIISYGSASIPTLLIECIEPENIIVSDTITTIGSNAFIMANYLKSIDISDTVTTICDCAFSGCKSLVNIDIPDSVSSIGVGAFTHCSDLISITIPDSVTTIGENAFGDCDNLTIYGYTGSYAETYANENNIPFVALDGTDTPSDPTETPIEAFEIVKNYDDPTGETYKIIGYEGTDENVVIPASSAEGDITSIYQFVFSGNTVKSVTLSKNINRIDSTAFSNAVALENIRVNENNTAFKAQDGILYNYDMTKLLCYPEGRTSTEFTVPDTVTTIGSFALSNIDLNKLVIGKNVTQIEQSAFFSSEFTIYGYKNSCAETYANENNIPFVALDGENPGDPDPIPCDHTYSTTYSYDATSHWYECTKCHNKDLRSYSVHSFGESVVTKEPTETETGISKETCKYCGYISTKEIPCLSNTIYVNEGESYTVTKLDAGKDIVVNGGKLYIFSEYTSYSFGALTVNSGDAFIRGGKFRAIGVNGGTLSIEGDVTVNESVYVVGGDGKLFGSDVKGGTLTVSGGSLRADKLVISEYGVFTMSGGVVDVKEFELSAKYGGSIFAGGTLWIKDSFMQKNEKFSASNNHTTIFYGASKKTVNYKDAVFGKLWLTESADYDHVNLYKVLSSKNAPYGIWQCNDSGTITIKDLSAEYLIDGDPNMISYEDYSIELMTDLYNAYKAKDPNSQSLYLSAVTVTQPGKQSFPKSYRNNAKPANKGYYIDFYMPEYISRLVSLCSYIFKSEYVSGEDGVQINEIIFKINNVDVGVNSTSNLRNVDIAFKVSGFSMSDGSFNTVQAAFYEGGTRNLIGCGIYSINASHTAFKDYAVKITNRLKSKSENWIKSYIKALLKDYKINPSVSNLTLNAVKKAAGSEKDIIELFEKMFSDIKQYKKFLEKTNNVKSATAFKSDIIDRLGNIEFISSSSKAYKDLYVYCPVDIYVYDEQMRLVGSIVNNVVDPSSEIDMYTEGDKKHFTLDADKKYFIKYVGNDTGVMDCGVTTYDDNGFVSDMLIYNDVELSKGLTYTQNINSSIVIDESYFLNTANDEVIIPNQTAAHEFDLSAWKSDTTSHWHECSCGDKVDISQHISNGGAVKVHPTATSTGLRVYSCAVCGYVIRTETIPATGYNNDDWYSTYPTFPTYPTYTVTPNVFTEKVTGKAEVSGNTVMLKWNKVDKAGKYYVYQYKNGKYVKIKTTNDTSVTFKDLKNGETYKFLVRYTINGKLSPTVYSSKFTVKVYYKPIPKPTTAKNSIKLTWEAVPDAKKYAVYKYVDGKAVKLTETKNLSVKINKLSPDTEYKYIVRAYVDGKWTTMLKSDILTAKTKSE